MRASRSACMWLVWVLAVSPAGLKAAEQAKGGAPQAAAGEARASAPVEPEDQESEEAEEPPAAEFEFVASTIFQNGLAAVRLGGVPSHVLLDAHFYGVETNEIGVTGLSYEFRHRGVRVMPGLGWAFGSENRPTLAGTVRWVYGSERWFSEGLFVQPFKGRVADASGEEGQASEGEDAGSVRHPGVFEAHVSARIGRGEIGPMVENVRYREEKEWKGGGRGAWRLPRGFKLVTQALAPDPELRIGLAWEP